MDKSTGIPYFYIANISDTYKNLVYNNSVSLSMTQAESSYCREQGYDPEEPLCARMILYGKVVAVSGDEEAFAKKAVFTRHPAMAKWPKYHGWRFYKLQLRGVCLLDFYGGATHVPLDKYFATTPPTRQYSRLQKLRDIENQILVELGESTHN
ncbi:Protein CREG1 [Lamellibrachia satsuma]|nr:Protein CREG1 [Lamellibrachia satsuma]